MERRLPHAPTAPAIARHLAADFVEDRLSDDRAEEFAVMVSEIVSNAVRHGSPQDDGRIGIRLEAEPSMLRVVVLDGAPPFRYEPAVDDDPMDEVHVGLRLVDRLADRWGVSLADEKAVWFEVDAP